VSIFILVCFLITGQAGTCPVFAQEFYLPAPGTRVSLSPEFNPSILKGIKVHPENPLRFDFILDQGDAGEGDLKEKASRLIKYFLASLTIPEGDLWVNLSPYEKNRVIPQSFGLTEMGRDLLAQDYMLKQITASLIYPEGEIGKKFWKRIYEEAARKYGTTEIPVNTFNKVWIVPDKSVIYENAQAGTAYVVESTLKVMLEQDYLALQKGVTAPKTGVSALGSQIIKEIVIPELTREVNEGKSFSQLRQAYNSLILATWYKRKIKDSILAQVYGNKKKISGLGYQSTSIEAIYQRYLQAFKRGAYNYIKEEIDPLTNQSIPRKYFSGGIKWGNVDLAQVSSLPPNAGLDGRLSDVTIDLAMDSGKDNATVAELPGVNEELPGVYERKVLFLDTLNKLQAHFPLIRNPGGQEVPGMAELVKALSGSTGEMLWEYDRTISLEGGTDIGGVSVGKEYIEDPEIRSPALVFLKLGLYFLDNLAEYGGSFGTKENTDAFQAFLDLWNAQNPYLPHFDVPMVLHLALAARTFKTAQLGLLSRAVYQIQDKKLLDKVVSLNSRLMSFHINYAFVPDGIDAPDMPIIEDELSYSIKRLGLTPTMDNRKGLSSGLSGILISLAMAPNLKLVRNTSPSMLTIKNILGGLSIKEIHRLIDEQIDRDLGVKYPLTIQRFPFSLNFWGFKSGPLMPSDAIIHYDLPESQDVLGQNRFLSNLEFPNEKLEEIRREAKAFYASWLNENGQDGSMNGALGSHQIGDLTFISLQGMHTPEDIPAIKAEYEKGLNDRSNVLFVPPDTSGPQDSITAYSAGFITAMQQHADRFKGATVIDAGSGSGILSLVALHLGAKKAVLIDMMDKQIDLSRALLTAHGYHEGVDFVVVKGDLEDDFPAVVQNVKELGLATDHLIGLANIGIWYGDANINSLKLFNEFGAELIINGGYPIQADNIDASRHIAGLQQNQAWLAQQGFKVQRTDHQYDKTIGVLVADHAQLSKDLGGIDLNSSKVNLEIKNSGAGIRFKIDEGMLEQLRQAAGLIPVIVKVQPMGDLRLFLGVTEG